MLRHQLWWGSAQDLWLAPSWAEAVVNICPGNFSESFLLPKLNAVTDCQGTGPVG